MDFKNIHSSYFNNDIKHLLHILMNNYSNLENLTYIKNFQIDNPQLFNMLTTLVILIQDTNEMKLEHLREDTYQEFRKVYKMFNKEYEDLSLQEIEQSKHMTIKKNNFQEFDNLILHLNSFHKLFQDILLLKVNQYQKLDKVFDLVEESQIIIDIVSSKNFQSESYKLNLLKPYLYNNMSLIQERIRYYLRDVNNICNDTNMTDNLLKRYNERCILMFNNFDKIKNHIKQKNEPNNKIIQHQNIDR